MIGRRVVPCLLLKDRGLYKTVRFKDPRYVGDPINALRVFNDKEVDEIMVLDIGSTHTGRIDFDLIEDFASECFMPLCYGGGICTIEQARRLFGLGLERVSINTAAVENPSLVTQVAEEFGTQSTVVSIDVKTLRLRGRSVVVRGGKKRVGGGPLAHARAAAAAGAGEILLTSVDREGTRTGYDLGLLGEITSAVDIPVIINGGAGGLPDLRAGFDAGASAVAAGSLFVFEGPYRAVLISYPSREQQAVAFGA
jgi:cyclase